MKKNKLLILFKYIALLIFFVFALFPIYWMLLTSLKPSTEAIQFPVRYWPNNFTLENYKVLLTTTNFPIFFKNSLIVSITSAFITLIISILAGYSLARLKFKGNDITMVIFLVTQMIPVVVMIVPLFILFAKLNLLDNLVSLIICYSIFNIPFCTIMIKGFFDRTPVALEEAAMIDGCSRFETLFRILVPVMLPGVIATFIFAFISAWNEYFISVMFINSELIKTIPVGMNIFISQFEVNWSYLSAGVIVALLPNIILFSLIQKFLIKGLTAGAVK